MNPEKRKVGVWYRVNQILDQVLLLFLQLVVLSSERNDFHIDVVTGQPRDLIGIKPGAVYQYG